jgi:hypothetical protein
VSLVSAGRLGAGELKMEPCESPEGCVEVVLETLFALGSGWGD